MNILVVDDDKAVRFALSELFLNRGFNIFEASNGEDALILMEKESVDIAVVDYQMPGMNGLELLCSIKNKFEHIEVIFITAFGNEDIAITAIKNGAYDYVAKPFDNEELLNRINHIAENIQNKKNNFESEYGYYFSTKMKNIIEKVKTIALTDIAVLTTGESGTGKELIAKIIHYYSKRTGEFVAVNCSALPDTLIESELFGAEKGAFTGAYNKKIGFFERADTGTIFLDEIGDMKIELQAKLLRVLQEGEIYRVGGTTPVKINARIVAATNINIEELVKQKKFREDLYYRLNGIKIEIPPLRKRKDEIKILAMKFINELNIKYKKNIKGFREDASSSLQNYNWPGNIRELKSKIEEAVVFCNTDWIENININNKNTEIENQKINKNNEEDDLKVIIKNINKFPKKLIDAKKEITDYFEKIYILYYLEKNKWNVAKTANEICVYRQDLYKKIKYYNIILKK